MTTTRERARRSAMLAVRGGAMLIGRRRAIRATRFAANTLRYDNWNRIGENGEEIVQRTIRRRARCVVLDVGANAGQWSMSLLAQPGGAVSLHAFEPSSFSFGRVSENLGSRAQVHRMALSSEPGEADLHVVRDGAGVNSLVQVDGERAANSTEIVKVETVDRFCEQQGILEIDLLKVDAEGNDFDVLQGAADLLERAAIGVAQFEYNWRWVYNRRFLKDAFDLVEGNDRYRLAKVTPLGLELYRRWHPELESFRECNYAIVREDWVSQFPQLTWWGG